MSPLGSFISIVVWGALAIVAAGEWSRGTLSPAGLAYGIVIFGMWVTIALHELCVAIRGRQ